MTNHNPFAGGNPVVTARKSREARRQAQLDTLALARSRRAAARAQSDSDGAE